MLVPSDLYNYTTIDIISDNMLKVKCLHQKMMEVFIMSKIDKARYWSGVCYPENMVGDWESRLPEILQLPFAYCKHTADLDSKSDHRKDHVHIILVFSNTTTFKHAMSVFDLLSLPGYSCISTCEAVIGIRNMYDYLIHDTDNARKHGKHQYSPSDRVTGNGFDIGSYEQLGVAEKNDIALEICDIILKQQFTNFADLYIYLMSLHKGDTSYFEVLKSNSGFFERLTRGNYQKVISATDVNPSHSVVDDFSDI